MSNIKKDKIGVVGYGRFGTLWTNLCRVAGYEIYVYDTKTPLRIQNERITVVGSKEEISVVDIVFFCVPISHMKQSISEIAPYISKECIVCDTCSVKEAPLALLRTQFPEPQNIIGLHPLFGPDSLDDDIHRQIIFTRERADEVSYQRMIDLLTSLQLKIVEMSAQQHDEEAVLSQGLTHLIGRTLDKLSLSRGKVCTKGYESLLEIIRQTCNDSEDLFYDLQNYNNGSSDLWKKLQRALADTIDEIKSHAK